MNTRKIVLDTETTGINKNKDSLNKHRIIEIGAVEIINRKITGKKFHEYINPKRLIDYEAYKIHGIKNEFLYNKPTFKEIYKNFIDFIKNSELIIHNAKFDIEFINYELSLINESVKNIKNICKITDSLNISRKKFPGKRNSLNALCERYNFYKEEKHSAIKDSELLAKIYLLLTSGQIKLELNFDNKDNILLNNYNVNKINKINTIIKYANKDELTEHKKILQNIKKKYRLKLLEE